MDQDQAILVYATVPNIEEAQKIADALVSEHLAACANIFPPIKSLYRWEGKIEQSEEIVVIFKTRAALFSEIEERIKLLHSYSMPCILAIPLASVSEPFLQWLQTETKIL